METKGTKIGERMKNTGMFLRELAKEIGENFYHLKDALSIIELETINRIAGGDHDVFICELVSYRNLNEGEPLSTSYLRHKKIIRA
jgi:flavin reductase (DIM6/NTAB) family NADH-FMN oxidoreductase RutF